MHASAEVDTTHLENALRHAVSAVRLARRRWTAANPDAPAGTVDLLAAIRRMADQASAGAGGCRLKDLAAGMGLDPSTVSREVSALMTAGLVERHPDPRDGRAAVLALSARGRRLLDDASDRSTRQIDDALAGWSPDERADLGRALDRFASDLDHYLQESAR